MSNEQVGHPVGSAEPEQWKQENIMTKSKSPNHALLIVLAWAILAVGMVALTPAMAQAKGLAGPMTLEQLTREVKRLKSSLIHLRSYDLPADSVAKQVLNIELADRRSRYRTRLFELRNEMKALRDGGKPHQEEEDWLKELLLADATVMADELQESYDRTIAHLEALGSGDDAKQSRALTLLRIEIPESDRLLEAGWQNISLRESLALDVTKDRQAMADRLTTRGQWQGGLLRTISISLDLTGKDGGNKKDAANTPQLSRLNKLEDTVAASTLVTIHLLRELGQPNTELSEALIVLTGSASGDVLNIKVLKRLFTLWLESVGDVVKEEGPGLVLKLLLIVLIVLVARSVSRFAERLTRRALDSSPIETSDLLKKFFVKSAGTAVFVIAFLVAIAQLGIQVGPLLAGLGIAGFVIGFALQDVLSNFASGMMILIYRPFDVGDFVEAGGVTGKVNDMTLVSTRILTLDNQLLFVPNTKIWGDVIRNVTHQNTRRVDLVFGIGYSDDIAKAEDILVSILQDHDMVMDDPEFTVKLHELADSSVNFVVRPWVKTEDYWDVYWDITRQVKERFDAAGVSIPFPQRDVHLYQEIQPDHPVLDEPPSIESKSRRREHSKATQMTEDSVLDGTSDDG